MPKLWNETIDTHRREVRQAILATAAGLAAEHGLLSLTMSEIADRTGIARATLYKYFPDVEAILRTWHQEQISNHLDELARARDGETDPARRLTAVLDAYASIQRVRVTRHHGQAHRCDFASFLHRDPHLIDAQAKLHDLIKEVISDAAKTGRVRDDVAPGELADYCIHALQAAGSMPTQAALGRLVAVTLAGLAVSGSAQRAK